MTHWFGRKLLFGLATALVAGALGLGTVAMAASSTTFSIVRSAGAVSAGCLPNAKGKVTVTPLGPVERMTVSVQGLPPNTDFDLFLIQLPDSPFGIGWYQGDIQTDAYGKATQTFLGRFSIETFAVAIGSGPAPVVFTDTPFPDASSNPPFNPIHTYHLGLWFNSPADAQAAGCPNTETAFNGTHTAGIQAMSTTNFPDDQGPLRQINP